MKIISSIVAAVAIFASSAAQATDRLVPEYYSTIQAAFAACSANDTVSVAAGTYDVGLITFPSVPMTLKGRSLASATVLTGEMMQVFAGSGIRTIENLTMRGFTGYAALQVHQASAVARSVIIEDGVESGVFLNTSATMVSENCVFRRNKVGGYGYVSCTWNATDCVFENNNSIAGSYGGGVGFHVGSGCNFLRCSFIGNGSLQGGAIGLSFGGSRVFDDCYFEGNTSPNGPVWWTEFGASGVLKNSTLCGHSVSDIVGGWVDGGGNQFYPAGCGQNLVVNGGLEATSAPTSCHGFTTYYPGSSAIPGWTIAGPGNIDWNWSTDNPSGSCCDWVAEGYRMVDMNGSPAQAMGGALRQSINTVIGRRYQISVLTMPNPFGGGPTTKVLRITTGSVVSDHPFVTPLDSCASYSNWTRVERTWVADTTQSMIEVRSMVPNSAAGMMVDDIRVTDVTVTVPGDYKTIQAAIDATPSGEFRQVNVLAGTYAGPINFGGRNVVVRGVSAAQTIIQGTGGVVTSVVRFTGEPAIAALENVTVRNGNSGSMHPLNSAAFVGGGIFLYNSGASIRDCVIEDNAAGFGGGIYTWFTTGSIERCIVRNNDASGDGGGMQVYGGSLAVVDSTFELNYCNSRGGGIHFVEGTHSLVGSTVRTNASNNVVGGVSWVPQAAVGSYLTVTDSDITGNTAAKAQGGIGVVGSGPVSMSLEDSTVCGNLPRPNINGLRNDLGGNTICDCFGDISNDGIVNGVDLAMVLTAWGTCAGLCSADVNHDGTINGADLTIVLSAWGVCPD